MGVVIGIASDYFTDDRRPPVHKTAKASEKGPALTILSGVSYGFLSVLPALVLNDPWNMPPMVVAEGRGNAANSEGAP